MPMQVFAPLVDLIYPPRCPLCGDGVDPKQGLCEACAEGIEPPTSVPPGFTAATAYTPTAKRLVLSFKHGRRIALAKLLAEAIVAQLPPLSGDWLVVPVPLHRWRLWQRGFNQAALIAGQIGRMRGQPVCVDALVRQRNTRSLSMSRAKRDERDALLAGAIAMNNARAKAVRGANVLLVDDVVTSGATSRACIAALEAAGTQRIHVACFARVDEPGAKVEPRLA